MTPRHQASTLQSIHDFAGMSVCRKNTKGGTRQAQRQTESVCHRACAVRLSVTPARKSPSPSGGLFRALWRKQEESGWERGMLKASLQKKSDFNNKGRA